MTPIRLAAVRAAAYVGGMNPTRLAPLAALLTAALLAGCGNSPPGPGVSRVGMSVDASFGRTWDAVIDAFAERGISIETLDRSSGLIVPAGRTYAPGRDRKESLTYADCGISRTLGPVMPATVKYNVVVRGDSVRSVVQVRAFYRTIDANECSTRGLYETEVEAAIKRRAETPR
jgi:predicted small secreted protein